MNLREMRPRDCLWLAAGAGLVSGVGEGVLRLGLRKIGAMAWNALLVSFSTEILWVSPLVNFLLFTTIGVLLAIALLLFPQFRKSSIPLFLLSGLACLNWLLIPQRLHWVGAIVLALGVGCAAVRAFPDSSKLLRLARYSTAGLVGISLLFFAFSGISHGRRQAQILRELPPAKAGAPNVLWIVMDTVRGDHVSSYGYSRKTTPRLDALAQGGVLFENAFSASSWSLPAHASLLTGLLPLHHQSEFEVYRCNCAGVPELLSNKGYRTAAISANTVVFSAWRGFAKGFSFFKDDFEKLGSLWTRTTYGRMAYYWVFRRLGMRNIPGRAYAEDVTDAALQWVALGGQRPFFLMLNYFDAHDPYLPPQPFRGKFSKSKNPGGVLNSFLGQTPQNLPAEMLESEVAAYDGSVSYVDDQIGKLLDGLRELNFLDNTIVVVTSDHGEGLGDHGSYGHGLTLYLSEIRVPMVFWWSNRLPAGKRVPESVSTAAIAATTLELLAMERSVRQVPSLTSNWGGSTPRPAGAPQVIVLSQLARIEFLRDKSKAPFWSLVDSQWHFLQDKSGAVQLYDWKADPKESSNLADLPENGKIVESFRAHLRQILAEAGQKAP